MKKDETSLQLEFEREAQAAMNGFPVLRGGGETCAANGFERCIVEFWMTAG